MANGFSICKYIVGRLFDKHCVDDVSHMKMKSRNFDTLATTRFRVRVWSPTG